MMTIETKGFALCQDCLRLQPLASLVPDANDPPGLCPACGGQTCDCPACLASVAELERGNWFGLQSHAAQRAISWSPEGGLVLRPNG
jgi:hypothetical protein